MLPRSRVAAHPGIRFRMIDEQQRIRPHIRIFIATRATCDPVQPVAAGNAVHLLCALSGGRGRRGAP
jgi:sulfur-carrier protein